MTENEDRSKDRFVIGVALGGSILTLVFTIKGLLDLDLDTTRTDTFGEFESFVLIGILNVVTTIFLAWHLFSK